MTEPNKTWSNYKPFKLTAEQISQLKQGTKIKFEKPFLGRTFIGRIEALCSVYDKSTSLYFCNEFNYDESGLTKNGEAMQFYNRFNTDDFYSLFEIL